MQQFEVIRETQRDEKSERSALERPENLKTEQINAFEENFEVESENENTVKTNPATF